MGCYPCNTTGTKTLRSGNGSQLIKSPCAMYAHSCVIGNAKCGRPYCSQILSMHNEGPHNQRAGLMRKPVELFRYLHELQEASDIGCSKWPAFDRACLIDGHSSVAERGVDVSFVANIPIAIVLPSISMTGQSRIYK